MIRKQIVRDEKIPRDANLRDAKVPWPFEPMLGAYKIIRTFKSLFALY